MRKKKEITYIVVGECWECNSHYIGTHGYPRIKINGTVHEMHRIAYEKANGKIPDGAHILHSCDNRKCINPDHLRIGTNAENVKDSIKRQLSATAKPYGTAKLTLDQVVEIRANSEDFLRVLAEKYNVSIRTIWAIRNNKRWKYESANYNSQP